MNKLKFAPLVLLCFLVFLSGCSLKATRYSQTIDASKTDFSKIASMKKGTACAQTFLIPISKDDSLASAIKDGGITVVKHVEKEYYGNTKLAFGKNCTIVYGE
jgi:hypothetical protein